ncbi:hypothetical protein K437DRAFT_64174 [Tilletiaria anomala UBC 951]|uniref:Uncharacterized protein n=1 Tax=Tilletiaria anomala (strain ATCC 24038 / CBS 436.72 / UBC 951) TaxID=1037660 RepID=A0A066V2T4_TILAU|nr:uncharacterized protein K437DRAFT_64174 [Tilletiaria anomala UBC 951]KDN36012.1 hypothetical protein K437DRAFT_64174 [Tilletiaria anomala UBC 951]
MLLQILYPRLAFNVSRNKIVLYYIAKQHWTERGCERHADILPRISSLDLFKVKDARISLPCIHVLTNGAADSTPRSPAHMPIQALESTSMNIILHSAVARLFRLPSASDPHSNEQKHHYQKQGRNSEIEDSSLLPHDAAICMHPNHFCGPALQARCSLLVRLPATPPTNIISSPRSKGDRGLLTRLCALSQEADSLRERTPSQTRVEHNKCCRRVPRSQPGMLTASPFVSKPPRDKTTTLSRLHATRFSQSNGPSPRYGRSETCVGQVSRRKCELFPLGAEVIPIFSCGVKDVALIDPALAFAACVHLM